MIDESIRGEVPDGYFKRVFVLLNPWSEKHWIKKRFFDTPDNDNKLSLTTNYKCNEWLTEDDIRIFEDMEEQRNPRRYAVAGLGGWGVADGLIYENWKEETFDVNEISKRSGVVSAFGLDFGYTNDPTAFFCGLLDIENKQIYVFDEIYEKAMSNKKIAETIRSMGYGKERIIADSDRAESLLMN